MAPLPGGERTSGGFPINFGGQKRRRVPEEGARLGGAARAASTRSETHTSDDDSLYVSDEEEEEEAKPPKQLVSKAAKLAGQMTSIAAELIESGTLVHSNAFTSPGQGMLWWYHDGTFWQLPFVRNAQYTALKAVLAVMKRAGRLDVVESLTDAHVKKLLDAANELVATGAAKVKIYTENDVTAMRKKARMMLAFRGGVVDLSVARKPAVIRPIPRDALVFIDEVADAECPTSMKELLAISTEELESVLKAILGEAWVLVTDLLVDTLRGIPTKALILLHSAVRSTYKSAFVATVLGAALTRARCPAPTMSAFMIGPKWADNTSSELAPTKSKMILEHGRSIVRYFDEVDNAKKTIHMTAVKGEQTPYGLLKIDGAHGAIQASIAPLYVASTNKSPESVFADAPSKMEAKDIYVIDTSDNLFTRSDETLTEDEKEQRDKLRVWLEELERFAPRKVKQSLALQVARLAVSWMTVERRAESSLAAELKHTLTLDAHRARAAAEQLAERRRWSQPVSGDGTEADSMLSGLVPWLNSNRDRFVYNAECRTGTRRGDLYRWAGAELFTRGGDHAQHAAQLVDQWMDGEFSVAPRHIDGGYMGYKGVRYIQDAE